MKGGRSKETRARHPTFGHATRATGSRGELVAILSIGMYAAARSASDGSR